MKAFLANIHREPENAGHKLAYAEWYDESLNSRAGLIRAREAFRQDPNNAEAMARCLKIAASEILGAEVTRIGISSLLSDLLEERALRMHEADCAQRVLCVFERKKPADNRPRTAIEACRAFAAMKIGVEELLAAGAAAREAADELDDPENAAGKAAGVAAEFGVPYGASSAASLAEDVLEMVAGLERAEAELDWQFGRLIDLWLYGWDYPLPKSEQNAL